MCQALLSFFKKIGFLTFSIIIFLTVGAYGGCSTQMTGIYAVSRFEFIS